jgi:hypothetical protein
LYVEVTMNSRIDQAIDVGVSAGLMYLFDPDQGERRRDHLLDQAKERLDQAGKTAAQAAKRAGNAATLAGRRVGEAALQTARQARDGAMHTAYEARDRAGEAGQKAGQQVLYSTLKTGRRARVRIEDAVPVAKAALMEKLALDDPVIELTRAALSKNRFLAPAYRRSVAPWALLLALPGGAAMGASLMFILDS